MEFVGPARPGADFAVVRLSAVLRVAVVVPLAAAGSFIPHLHGRSAAFFLVSQLVWLPLATFVLFASAREGSPLALVGGPLGDLGALFAVQVLVPSSDGAVLIGYLLAVALAVYSLARRYAVALAATAIMVATIAQTLVPRSARLSLAQLVPFCVAMALLVLMLERTVTRQAATDARVTQLQGRSATVLEHVADAVVVTTGSGEIVECNPAALRLLGRDIGIVGHSCAEVLALHCGERARECLGRCELLDLEGTPGVELWRERPDGRRQPLLGDASDVPAVGGTEVVHSLRDITKVKQAEEAKTLFLATASHELKTPLTVIQGFSDTLARYPDLDSDTKAAALDAIRVRSVELARIVDRLLVSSRIESGMVNIIVGPVDVAPVVHERVVTMAAATGRAVIYEGPVVGGRANANLDAIVTVVEHLVDNAIKYSPGGEPVTVVVDPDPDGLVIEVRDQGIGMDDEQQQHCFDRFWQAESSDVRRFGGTGIGLYIVKSLVEGMGAALSVRTELGLGSTFSVRLHRAEEQRMPGQPGASTSIVEFMRQLGVGAGGGT
ncbi:MAG: sensor histidine kinase [Acidimicrobiales bacterium]